MYFMDLKLIAPLKRLNLIVETRMYYAGNLMKLLAAPV